MPYSAAFASAPTGSPAASVLNVLDKFQAKELVIPFLLTFVIIYGVLDTIKIFQKNSINSIVALAVAFFAIFYGPYGAMGAFLTQLYGTGAVVVVGLVVFMIILGALSLGGNRYRQGSIFQRLFGNNGGVVAGVLIIIVFMFLLMTGWFSNIGLVLDADTTALMIIILAIIMIFIIVAHPGQTRRFYSQWFPPHPDEGF